MTRRLVKFLVSGFGPFLGVDRNPTQSLVEYLASRTGPGGALLSSGCEDELIQVLGTAVMRVSAEAVDAHLAQLVAVLQQEADILCAAVSVPCAGSRPAATAPTAPAASGTSTAPVRPFSSPGVGASSTRGSSIVLLHLGVANTATTYRLESRAYNCATFRVPDANGWSPQRQELEPGRLGGLEGWVGSALPLEEMAKALTAKGHGDVLVSTNAGRFICNWCYYRSCRHIMQIEEQSAPSVAAPLPCGGDEGGSGGAAGGSIAASGSGASSCNAAATTTAASATAAGGSTTPATAAARSGGSNSCSGGSNDGGRGAQRRWHSLFIHVPPFSVYDEDAQRAFLIDAIREVAARVTAFDNGLDAQLEQQQRGDSCYGDGAGGGVVADAAATAETAAAAAHDSADHGGGFGRLRPTVVQGTGLPEPSPEQLLLEQQQRMLLPVVTVAGTAAALEDASAGGGDGVGVGVSLLEITDGR